MCCRPGGSSSRATRRLRSSSSSEVTASSKTRLECYGTLPMSAIVDFPVKPEARPYLEAFARAHSQAEPDWLARYRNGSLARFAEVGFPSRRSEAWRYLDLRPLEQRAMLPAGARASAVPSAARAQIEQIGLAASTHRLVLIDGRFVPELSRTTDLPSGVWLRPMKAAIIERPDLIRSGLEPQSG